MKVAVAAEDFPAPLCEIGYPHSQLEQTLSVLKMKDFLRWMMGQTFSMCTGQIFDYATNRMVPSNCGPHGFVYYTSDVRAFLDGRQPLD